MKDKDAVERACQYGIGFVVFTWCGEHHVHEVFGIREVVFWIIERQTVGITVTHCRNRRNFGNQTVNRDFAVFGVRDVQTVLIECRQCTDHADHHRHRMRITAEAAEEPSQLFMHHRMTADGIVKFCLLLRCRQFAVNQQITDFQIIGFFGKLFNRITTVIQQAFVAVDISDFGLAACC